MVYGAQITIVTGANLNQRSHHWGDHIVEVVACPPVPHLPSASAQQDATRFLLLDRFPDPAELTVHAFARQMQRMNLQDVAGILSEQRMHRNYPLVN